jgi:hypothetical protein
MSDESAPLIPTSSSTSAASSKAKKNMYWTLGCIYGATAVGFGAFGAHGLKKIATDPAKIASFSTAAHYQVSTSDNAQPTFCSIYISSHIPSPHCLSRSPLDTLYLIIFIKREMEGVV